MKKKKKDFSLLPKGKSFRLTPTQKAMEKFREVSRKHTAKILIMDIETAPMRAYTWGIWNQNINLNQIISEWFVLCWSAKWLFDDKVISGKLNKKELDEEDDFRIMQKMWALLNDADIVITHNGDKFDLPKLNTRFLLHGMMPPTPFQSIDTLKVVKKMFKFTSNKLDYINKMMGLNRKVDTGGWELWQQCAEHDIKALKKMSEYCDNDVLILEESYIVLRPWIKPHPNIGLFIIDDVECCPSCGSEEIKMGGVYRTQMAEYYAFRCQDCGALGRQRRAANKGLNLKLIASVSK